MNHTRYYNDSGGVTSAFGCLIAGILMIAAWITHVVVCISASKWILLVIGALFFPIGIIHGIMVWFGAGW